jgi:hypothetical protein
MQKVSKKNYDFFVARIEGSRDQRIGRHAGSARVVAKNDI